MYAATDPTTSRTAGEYWPDMGASHLAVTRSRAIARLARKADNSVRGMVCYGGVGTRLLEARPRF